MAGYIQITPTYNPISLSEYMYVPTQYWKAQDDMENKLDKFSENIGTYEQYARMYPNTEMSKQYLNFIDNFDKVVDEFYKNGYNSTNANMFRNLRNEYKRVSTPFKQAAGTYSAIAAQQAKDAKNGLIGGEVTFEDILNNPTYSLEDYNRTHYTGQSILNESKNLFSGLNQFDATPTYEMSNDGKFVSIITPQSYSSNDIYTAFTGEGYGHPTEELINTVNILKQKYDYDNLSDSDKESFLYYAMQGAAKSIKNPKISNRAVPKGSKVNSDGTVIKANSSVPQFKGYTSVTIDNGETLYKKGSQYYRATPTEDGKYNMTAVTDDVVIGGKVFGQKKNSQPGTLAPVDEKTLIKDFGYHSFGEESAGSPVNKPIVGYKAKAYSDLASITGWKDITTRIRNYVTSVMVNQGFKNYSFNPNDVEIRVKYTDNKEKDVEDVIVKIKNPSYKASNTSKKQQKDATNDFNWN